MNNIEQYRKRFDSLLESTLGNVKPLLSEGDGDTPKKWKVWRKEGYEYSSGTITPNKNDMFYGQLSVVNRYKESAQEHLRQTIYFKADKKGFDRNVDGLIVCKDLDNGKFECRFLTKEKLF